MKKCVSAILFVLAFAACGKNTAHHTDGDVPFGGDDGIDCGDELTVDEDAAAGEDDQTDQSDQTGQSDMSDPSSDDADSMTADDLLTDEDAADGLPSGDDAVAVPDEIAAVDDDAVAEWDLALTVTAVTSGTVTLSWNRPPDATALTLTIGPEPAATPGGELPSAIAGPVLSADAEGTTLTGIAAATDLFIRLTAQTPAGEAVGAAHARTAGGPRAELDTALREVHGYGPSVLMLVLADYGVEYNGTDLDGDLGPSWQAGTWSVTRGAGAPVAVTAVHRHTVPVGQTDYPVGFGVYGDDNILDIDHRIFLELAEPLGARDMLRVTHTGDAGTALDVIVPFSDRYLETPLIKVNQVGYSPRATRRYAYLSGYLGDGAAADLSALPANAEVLAEPLDPLDPRAAVLTALPITVRAAGDTEAGGEVREIDIKDLSAADGVRYRVRVPGVGVSWPTAVSDTAVFKSFYTAWRGLFHNRWCGDLTEETTEWSRPADHCSAFFVQTGETVTFFPEDTPQTDERPLGGGHHDAGDVDIRPYHVVVAQYLMRAFEMDPSKFSDGQTTIPESGNGIPDILDEALWSVAAWEALQNADGSVRDGVESWRHPAGYYYASDDELPYWTFDPQAWHTAYTAGLFAQAAYLVQPYDATRSAALAERAADAYAWAKAQGAPEEFLLYGAGELFRLTGTASYKDDYAAYWNTIDKYGRGAYDNVQVMTKIYPGSFTSYTPAMADFTVAYYLAAGAVQSIRSTTLSEMTGWADDMAGMVTGSAHAYRNGREDSQAPDWGVSAGTGRQVDMVYQRLQLGGLSAQKAQDYLDAISLSADYILGCNPAGAVYVSGLGSRPPMEPLHTDSLAFIKDKGMPPVPGIPVYGPVNGMPGAYWYDPIDAAFYPPFDDQPLGLRISDTRASVNMNEFSVWEMQAPLAELFAALVPGGMTPPADWLPGGAAHRDTLPPFDAE